MASRDIMKVGGGGGPVTEPPLRPALMPIVGVLSGRVLPVVSQCRNLTQPAV